MKKHPLPIWMILFVLLASCTWKPSAALDDTTCEAPCWRGIVAGESTIQEVEPLVNAMPDVTVVSIVERTGATNPYYEQVISWQFDSVAEHRGEVYFRNDRSTLLYITTNNRLPLSDFIEKFGEPSVVFIQSTVGDPTVYLTLDLIYLDMGICLSQRPPFIYPFKNPETYRIKPSTEIREVSSVDLTIPNGQLQFGCLAGMDEKAFQEERQEWKGYGEYDVFSWDEILRNGTETPSP